MLLSGPTGVGKTWFGLAFPSVYYMDSEKGANRQHYTDRLKAGGGRYMGPEDGTLDPDTVIEQFAALASEKHEYRTVVFDSLTKLFQTMIAREQEKLGDKDAFGASKKPAVAFMRRLITWVDRLDMNVIFIAHETAEWGLNQKGERAQIGVTADVWDKLPYELDLWLQAAKRGPAREAKVRKSRLIGFPEAEVFSLDYPSFSERYGKDIIEKAASPVVIASPEEVAEIGRLLEIVKMSEDEITKWFNKAGVENWKEMTREQITKCIAHLKGKIA